MHAFANAPFDDPEADVILESRDGIAFQVYRMFLSDASPLFQMMFTLPQPPVTPSNECDACDLVPTIPLAEDNRTVDCLLRTCYPITPPVVKDLCLVEQVMEAAQKYDMDVARHWAENALTRLASHDAVGAYATACRFELEDAAQVAARHTLRLLATDVVDGLLQEGISRTDLRALLKYRQRCCDAALVPTHSWAWASASQAMSWHSHNCPAHTVVWDRKGRSHRLPTWWAGFITGVATALKDTPWEGVVDATSVSVMRRPDPSSHCAQCRARTPVDVTVLMRGLHAQIAMQVAKVRFALVLSGLANAHACFRRSD